MAAAIIISPFSASVESLPGGAHFINNHVKIEALSDEVKLKITEYLDSIEEENNFGKHIRNRPAFSISYNDISFLKPIKQSRDKCNFALQIHRFCLEYFAKQALPMVAFHYDGKDISSHEIDRDGLIFRNAGGVEFDRAAWDRQLTYAKFVYDAIDKAPAAETVLGRICRAFREGPTSDGIIDIAIALESLAQGRLEIRFQFSLFNSLIESADLERRNKTFNLLKELYDVRSITVHGGKPSISQKKNIKNIVSNWSDIMDLSRSNLTYYLNYCAKNDPKSWADHLRNLAMGSPRFVSEEANG